MFIAAVHFAAMLFLVTSIARWFTIKAPNNPVSDAILFALG